MLPTTLRDGAYVPKRVKEEIDFDGPIERGAKKMRAQRVRACSGVLSTAGRAFRFGRSLDCRMVPAIFPSGVGRLSRPRR